MKKHKYIGEKTNWRGVRFTLTGYPESDNPMHNGILVMIEIDGESMGWIEHGSENDKGWFMRASSKFNIRQKECLNLALKTIKKPRHLFKTLKTKLF